MVCVTVERGSGPIMADLYTTVSDGARGGAASDVVVEQETSVGVQGLATGGRPHPQLHPPAVGDHIGPTIEVTTQRHQGETLLPDLDSVLALVSSVPQGEVHHLQLYPLSLLGQDGPDTLPASEIISRISWTGDVALPTDSDPTSTVRQDPSLAGVSEVSPSPAPADGLGEVPGHVKGALAISDSAASPDNCQEDVSIVVKQGSRSNIKFLITYKILINFSEIEQCDHESISTYSMCHRRE